MSMFETILTKHSPQLLSILRIVAALLFLAHGTAKYLGFPVEPHLASLPALSPSGVGGLLELCLGPLLLLGLFTRPVAFLLSGEMAVAYFWAHAPRNLYPLLNGGESSILFCFLFLYIASVGSGAWGLDTLRSGSRLPERGVHLT